ncbi:hypothetical protein ElyMa_004717700 [Elysia marginata]|uniref:EF-hand domain-containing protein n=1 Tax=Elysia marginata TaxID=1093978 RepID=A0AAV4I9F2_9GAST|nr:hypothetical protein ElyMa_004717700 [Elysia marginata]
MIEMFRSIEDGETGNADMEKAFDALKTVETAKGALTDEEIENFLKATAGESKTIDLHKFLNLLCRLKVYKVNFEVISEAALGTIESKLPHCEVMSSCVHHTQSHYPDTGPTRLSSKSIMPDTKRISC